MVDDYLFWEAHVYAETIAWLVVDKDCPEEVIRNLCENMVDLFALALNQKKNRGEVEKELQYAVDEVIVARKLKVADICKNKERMFGYVYGVLTTSLHNVTDKFVQLLYKGE